MKNQLLLRQDNPCPRIFASDRKIVIFDLDGTLIDSFECVLRCVNKALDSLSLPRVHMPRCIRHGNISDVFEKAKEITQGILKFSEFKKLFDEIHLEDCTDSIVLDLNIYNQMVCYVRQGVKIVILTNKYQPIAEKICQTFFFDLMNAITVIGRKDEYPIKDDFKVIKQIFIDHDLFGAETLRYFGDSAQDKKLAQYFEIPFTEVSSHSERL